MVDDGHLVPSMMRIAAMAPTQPCFVARSERKSSRSSPSEHKITWLGEYIRSPPLMYHSTTALSSSHRSWLAAFSKLDSPFSVVLAALGILSVIEIRRFFTRRRILRRCVPILTDQDLDAIPGMPTHVRVAPSNRLSVEERETIKDTFLYSADFRWLAMGDHFLTTDFENQKSEAFRKLNAITCFLVEGVLRFAEKYANVVVLTENPRGEPPGAFLGFIAFFPPYPSMNLLRLHESMSTTSLGEAPYEKMEGGVAERIKSCNRVSEENHEKVMEGQQHWYISMVALSKAARGSGKGRQLIQAVVALAAEQGEPILVECSDDLVSLYEFLGFNLARKCDFGVLVPYNYNSMVFPAKEVETAKTASTARQ